MKRYVSIDIETTGLDPETCQVLEVGAVIEDWKTPIEELPKFQCYVKHSEYRGQPYALWLNSRIFEILANPSLTKPFQQDVTGVGCLRMFNIYHASRVGYYFSEWLKMNGFKDTDRIVAAGKNFGAFDLQFLKRLPHFGETIKFDHRYIDPGMLYWEPTLDDNLPGFDKCLARAGVEKKVSHYAVEDSQDVIKLIRHHFAKEEKWAMR